MATEVAYYTYIYAKVEKEHFQKVTSHTRAAILAGRTLSGVLAQLLISLNCMDYRELNYISFAAMLAATLWSFLLPAAHTSIYFHRIPERQHLTSEKYKKAFTLMKSHFVESYMNKHVLKWSFWWALATCGFIQVQTYMQPLWAVIQTDSDQTIYNGATEAVLTLLGFAGALLAGIMKVDWKYIGELVLAVCSIVAGSVMLISSQTDSIYVSYVCYVVFGAVYHFMITIASSEIAQNIKEDSYGLVFGLNTLIALCLQSVMTVVVVQRTGGFALGPRNQYLVYGLYHMAIAFVYIFIGLVHWVRSRRDVRKTYS